MSFPTPSLHHLREALRQGRPVVIVGLGDSLTFGWEVERGFFDRAMATLAERYPTAPVQGLNAGVPGDTAQGGSRRLAPLLARAPDVVVVQFGLNDAFLGVPLPAFERSIEDLATRCRSAGAVPVLATSCPLRDARDNDLADRYYHAITTVGGRLGCPVAALHAWWRRHAPENAALHGSDGVHPADQGHRLMADGLLAALGV
jgi:acyl-CoA thioesterase-1